MGHSLGQLLNAYGAVFLGFIACIKGPMRQRKLGSHMPPCHRRMVITTLFSVLLAALQRRSTSSIPHKVVADCALALVLWTLRSARTHHPPTMPVSL